MASFLFIVSSHPYESEFTEESHDLILSSTAYGHTASVVFIDDGVFQLLDTQRAPSNRKNAFKRISGFEMFDVEPLYVSRMCCDQRDIDSTHIMDKAQWISEIELNSLKQSANFVIML